ncbi:MAG TPA: CerR family C-terminal domain-containing protein [Pirellulales bacterium]|nr:CerR family C-terminal domain-containing protein [Pirellulales bacterium]
MATDLTTDTRQRILDAAGPVFAHRGFKDATVREICQAARVNVAAVNYYFGDKERLYIEAVKRAHRNRMDQAPLPEWSSSATPEQKLYDFVRTLLIRILHDPAQSWHTELMLRELLEPTAACAELARDYIRPQFDTLLAILATILPAEVSREDRHLAAFSIVGQCLYHRVAQPIVEALIAPDEYRSYSIDRLAQHITSWSLAALGGGGVR